LARLDEPLPREVPERLRVDRLALERRVFVWVWAILASWVGIRFRLSEDHYLHAPGAKHTAPLLTSLAAGYRLHRGPKGR
jgi:hypothetical protein